MPAYQAYAPGVLSPEMADLLRRTSGGITGSRAAPPLVGPLARPGGIPFSPIAAPASYLLPKNAPAMDPAGDLQGQYDSALQRGSTMPAISPPVSGGILQSLYDSAIQGAEAMPPLPRKVKSGGQDPSVIANQVGMPMIVDRRPQSLDPTGGQGISTGGEGWIGPVTGGVTTGQTVGGEPANVLSNFAEDLFGGVPKPQPASSTTGNITPSGGLLGARDTVGGGLSTEAAAPNRAPASSGLPRNIVLAAAQEGVSPQTMMNVEHGIPASYDPGGANLVTGPQAVSKGYQWGTDHEPPVQGSRIDPARMGIPGVRKTVDDGVPTYSGGNVTHGVPFAPGRAPNFAAIEAAQNDLYRSKLAASVGMSRDQFEGAQAAKDFQARVASFQQAGAGPDHALRLAQGQDILGAKLAGVRAEAAARSAPTLSGVAALSQAETAAKRADQMAKDAQLNRESEERRAAGTLGGVYAGIGQREREAEGQLGVSRDRLGLDISRAQDVSNRGYESIDQQREAAQLGYEGKLLGPSIEGLRDSTGKFNTEGAIGLIKGAKLFGVRGVGGVPDASVEARVARLRAVDPTLTEAQIRKYIRDNPR